MSLKRKGRNRKSFVWIDILIHESRKITWETTNTLYRNMHVKRNYFSKARFNLHCESFGFVTNKYQICKQYKLFDVRDIYKRLKKEEKDKKKKQKHSGRMCAKILILLYYHRCYIYMYVYIYIYINKYFIFQNFLL